MIYVYGFPKGCNIGITRYINLKNSGNDQKGNYYYHTSPFTVLRGNLN